MLEQPASRTRVECIDCGAEQTHRVCANCFAKPVFGALARAEALAAGYPDWMNVTRWPVASAPSAGES